jgi:hypothetical protein
MGNWHCIPSSCVEVVYQTYEPPKIRWRYPGFAWQEIIGADDYTITQPQGQCNTGYLLKGRYESAHRNFCRQIIKWYSLPNQPIPGKIIGFEERIISGVNKWVILYQLPGFNQPIQAYTQLIDEFFGYFIIQNKDACSSGGGQGYGWTGGFFSIDSIKRADNQPDNCGDCVFIVTKNGQVVHTETRAVCPEVQKIPCKLSDVRHSIEIKKLPLLEKVEVVPYQYSAYKLPGVPAPIVQADKIPAECLNIYNNAIYVIPPSGEGIYPDATPFDSFVTQICSASGCPPPEYQVICDCNSCESCPDGTCAVECDGQICCYDSDGVSVKQIATSNYCGVTP